MSETQAEAIRRTIRHYLAERGDGKTFCPSEVARTIAGSNEKEWRKLMAPIRKEAVEMAESGELTIRRKGETVDPGNFKGIYRIGAPGPSGCGK